MNILATVLGLCAVALFVLSYQLKSRRGIIFFNAASRVLYVAQYILLGAFEGALLDVVALFVSILCGKSERGFVKKHFVMTVILSNVAIVSLGMLTYKNIFSLLPILGVIFETLALWLKKEKHIRFASLLGAPFWLAYNLISLAYGSAIGNVITLVSITVAIIRYDVLKRHDSDMEKRDMKFMSFNTQHCLSFVEKKIDFELMAKAIIDLDADVVGLNEMRGQGADAEYTAQVERLAELCGMRYYYFAKAIDVKGKGPYGNGILSRIPIIKAETVSIPDPPTRQSGRAYETRCVLKAELEGGVSVLVTHFGLNPDEQENAVRTVVENLSDRRCILMGDFNVTPEDLVLEPIRSRMLDTADISDSEKLSFPSDKPDRKIDYLFVSRDVTVIEADVPSVVASDHRPYIAKVSF